MNNNTFTYRIMFKPYGSVRLNILPRVGTITLDDSGVLTLVDTSAQTVVVQKPFGEFLGVRSLNYISNRVYSVILYVGFNETYEISFGSENQVLTSGMDMYEKLLSGDKQGAIEEFKEYNIAQAQPGAVNAAMQQAGDDCASFITSAKQAGIYKSSFVPVRSIGNIFAAVVFIAIVLYFAYVFIKR